MTMRLLIIFIILLIPNLSYANDDKIQQSKKRPSSVEVKKVLDHLYNGHGNGVFLYDIKICKTIEKNDCTEEVDSNSVVVGDKVRVWMYFFGPVDDHAIINYEYKYKNRTRKASMFNIKGAYRYRTSIPLVTNNTGAWEFLLYQEVGDDIIDLGVIKYTVNEVEVPENKGFLKQLLAN